MSEEVGLIIDTGACTGCEICVTLCPSDRLIMRGHLVFSQSDTCIACDHCAGACPVEAIRLEESIAKPVTFQTLPQPKSRPNLSDSLKPLLDVMVTRRSCRSFRDKEVPRDVLEDLVRIGTTAPSGTNSQKWTFTILEHRAAVANLGESIGDFFRRLNRLASRASARIFSRIFFGDALGKYYREYYERVVEALRQYDETGRDRLFHGAPCAILIGMKPGASCPQEDALLASQNILLTAHALGLGTCLIGYAVEALRHDKRIGRQLGLPEDERVYAVIALGYPKVRFFKPAGRRPISPRFVD